VEAGEVLKEEEGWMWSNIHKGGGLDAGWKVVAW
jgi:hypothetical protein